jgi:uncharacterized membrane protein YuzA (DUF378 family)
MGHIVAILFLIAGIVGCLPLDTRIAWALVAIAGLLMIVGVG